MELHTTHVKQLSIILLAILALLSSACQQTKTSFFPLNISQSVRSELPIPLATAGVYRLSLQVDVKGDYAALDVYIGTKQVANNLNLPNSGKNRLNVLINLETESTTSIGFEVKDADAQILSYSLEPVSDLVLPAFLNQSEKIGLERSKSIKYGGPTIADIDQDGDYDFIVNNHNEVSSKLYWNDGFGSVTKHHKDLARWFMHDLHGTAAGDYDNDGDLDLVVTMGGGNGTNPSKANFYLNDNNHFVLHTGDVGIDRGGRGRGARWIDADVDGDLDLLLFNEMSLKRSKLQHFFYENLGNGRFQFKEVAGPQEASPSRVLVTDINQDLIDDIIFYGHHKLSVWQGNGDFTYSDLTDSLPAYVGKFNDIMAIVDIDIDNDGDLDLFLARGKEFGIGSKVSMDFDAKANTMSIKPKGTIGREVFQFTSSGPVTLFDYHYQAQVGYRNKIYPIFLGAQQSQHNINPGSTFVIDPAASLSFPKDTSKNGIYLGVIGQNDSGDYVWQATLVRNSNLFWGFGFSLDGINTLTPDFDLENRNLADVLLINDNGVFIDGSDRWNVPKGGNSLGVTRGDFNNDGSQDLLIYRWGRIGKRIADLMLLNYSNKTFEAYTQHGANDIGGPGNGDMGQAFDFDLDGQLDLLSGSEGGYWYLYSNQSTTDNHHLTVKVGYSPKHNIDAYGATVKVNTDKKTYLKRVGSSGEVFSQSLLNNVHFGLGNQNDLDAVKVIWRNGEEYVFTDVDIDSVIETPKTEWFKQTRLEKASKDTKNTHAPYVRFHDRENLVRQGLRLGEIVTLAAEYHAGTGKKVIAADEGGIRFWLRHFRYKWLPAEDRTLVDTTPLYSETGDASVILSMDGITPSDELPKGHFYQLRVSFMNSSGEMVDDKIDYLKIKW
ncbi:MAG: hypothetical protein Alis3KO_28570 [Aliiglaciecola sp.]